MQGHYHGEDGARPGHRGTPAKSACAEHGEGVPARQFLCAAPICRARVLICSRCDRGQIYCARGCAQEARRIKQREANRRYQKTFRGRRNHAARTACYRARQKKVTYQGSPPRPPGDVVSADSTATNKDGESSEPPTVPVVGDGPAPGHCHWCACRCPDKVRRDFLRRRRVHSIVRTNRIGHRNDYSP